MKALLIARVAVAELLHERAFYVLFSFVIATFFFGLLLGQMTYAEQAKLTLDFMLGFTHLSMILFSVFMGISLFQRELQSGSVSMVVSKPISRTTFLLGKYMGQICVQTVLTLLMGIFTILVTSRLTDAFSPTAVFQTVCLISCELAILTSITYAFAVNAGAVTATLCTLAVFALGHTRGLVSENLKTPGEIVLWRSIRTVIPDLDVFNMKALASYGQAIAWSEVGLAMAYALISLGFFLTFAVACFERKDILT